MKNFIIILIIMTLLSCNDNIETNYYENGYIKSELYKDNDSLVSYYNRAGKKIKNHIKYQGSLGYQINYTEKGAKYSEGWFDTINAIRVGKWKFYSGDTIEIQSYKNIRNEQYLNQVWLLNKDLDTIGGHYFLMDKNNPKDTININETVSYRFLLIKPLLSKKSQIFLVVGKNKNFTENFTNEDEIEHDTIKNFSISPTYNIPKQLNTKRLLGYTHKFNETGEQVIRYILKEIDTVQENGQEYIRVSNIYDEIKVYVEE